MEMLDVTSRVVSGRRASFVAADDIIAHRADAVRAHDETREAVALSTRSDEHDGDGGVAGGGEQGPLCYCTELSGSLAAVVKLRCAPSRCSAELVPTPKTGHERIPKRH